MALPVIFGPLTAAQMSQLDQDFAAVGALVTIRTSATGTNSIVLTPAANQPAVGGYGLPNPVKFSFTASATSTGAVQLEVATLGFLPVYTINGVQATTGTLVNGNYYEVTYTTGSIYNAGAGAWVLSSYQPGTGLVVVAPSSVRGLKIANNSGTPNTQVDISFQQATLVSAVGTPAFLGILSATIDLTTGTVTSTANGMDGESRPASGWLYIYAISTGSGMAGLGTTTSPLAGPPTLPAGYAYYAYLGAMRCDGSSNLLRTLQWGPNAQYVVTASTNTAVPPLIANGILGTFSTGSPVYFNQSVSSFMPPTAGQITLLATNGWKGGSACAILVAPNSTNYGGTNNGPLGSNGLIPPVYLTNANAATSVAVTMVQEQTSQNIGFVSSGAAGAISALGWSDYVSAAA